MSPRALLPLLAALLASPGSPAPPRREAGNLVSDGIPELPRRLLERAAQYTSARGALLLDWDPPGAGGGLLIATRFGETFQVHHVAAPGADRRQLTFFPEPVTEAVVDPKQPGGFYFRMDTGGGEFYQYLWFDRKTGRHFPITDGKSRNESLLCARGGGKLALVSTRRNGTDFDLYLVGSDGKPLAPPTEVKGQWNPLDFAPDDAKLLVRHYVSINESALFVWDPPTRALTPVNPAEGKKISYTAAAFAGPGRVVYSADEDSEFLRPTLYDLASGKKELLAPDLKWDVDELAVSRDGRWLAYAANEAGASVLYLAPLSSPRRAQKIALPAGVLSSLRFDRQSRRLGFALNTPTSPSDVYSVDLRSRKLERWTTGEVGGLDPTGFVAPELVTFPTFDGRSLSAWVFHPAPTEAGKRKVPVIVDIHGGPEAQSRPTFSPLVQYFAIELGAAVLLPNVRGSSGYGKSFLLLDNGERREDSVRDIGKLLDWIGTRPELDPARVAVFGGSYGGYMSLATMVHFGDRLRCGIDIVGISNFVTFLQHTEGYRRDLRRAEYGDERNPEMRKLLESISPLTNAGRIRRPLFVAQGKNDPRVPASEAEQIVRTVRGNGGAVWFLLAKDEGHGFQKKGNIDVFTAAAAMFLEEYLLK